MTEFEEKYDIILEELDLKELVGYKVIHHLMCPDLTLDDGLWGKITTGLDSWLGEFTVAIIKLFGALIY